MTKVDKENFKNNEKLPMMYNDAHAALRGFANSDVESSIVLSAGMSPRLYTYISEFKDFFPNEKGHLKKKITLKVSDYRSALVQGKFLAKKGLWVSEFRIESGLNCGGHAFATDGFLLGPILEEFKNKKQELLNTITPIYQKALTSKGNITIPKELQLKITAQGGVGTNEEHEFLLDYYNVDAVGWGTPFLLVPEATSVDEPTIKKLQESSEKDLYLSGVSPLGVPFNNLKGNTRELEEAKDIDLGKPGTKCTKRYLALNKDSNGAMICTASKQYMQQAIKELKNKNLPEKTYQKEYKKIIEKTCLCVGLGKSAFMINDINESKTTGTSICPGPNMAYFSKIMKLKDIISHIYGRTNVISRNDRPNMFIKELNIYIDFLKNKISETTNVISKKQEEYLTNFANNLNDGINYYHKTFNSLKTSFKETKQNILNELDTSKKALQKLILDIKNLSIT